MVSRSLASKRIPHEILWSVFLEILYDSQHNYASLSLVLVLFEKHRKSAVNSNNVDHFSIIKNHLCCIGAQSSVKISPSVKIYTLFVYRHDVWRKATKSKINIKGYLFGGHIHWCPRTCRLFGIAFLDSIFENENDIIDRAQIAHFQPILTIKENVARLEYIRIQCFMSNA